MSAELDHVWWWRARLGERKGQRCRVLARGGKNTVEVEFEDGHRVFTCRHAVRRIEPTASPRRSTKRA